MITAAQLEALDAMHPTAEERAWAIRQARDVDPGTDTPADKLRQRRLQEHKAVERSLADQRGENPLEKATRVWDA